MKYYTFLPEFHQAILNKTKASTIRLKPKVEPGERFALRFWSDKPYRSKMGFLGTALCSKVLGVSVGDGIVSLHERNPHRFIGDPVKIISSPVGLKNFSDMEGFSDPESMFSWFAENHGPIFFGILTVWDRQSFIPGPPENHPCESVSIRGHHNPEAPDA